MTIATVRSHLTAALAALDELEMPETPTADVPPRATLPLVWVDAGHGGHDPGAVAGDSREKDLALQYARALADVLRSRGAGVKETRIADVFVGLGDRAAMANAAGAACFVSVHANAADSRLAHGAWVIHDDSAGAAGGVALAGRVFDRLAKVPGILDSDPAREVFPDASPQVGGRQLAVLSQTKMPAILVELGFMTNEEDLSQLKDGPTQEKVVGAIADGVEDWLRTRAL